MGRVHRPPLIEKERLAFSGLALSIVCSKFAELVSDSIVLGKGNTNIRENNSPQKEIAPCFRRSSALPAGLDGQITFLESARIKKLGFAVREFYDDVFAVYSHNLSGSNALVVNNVTHL